MTYYRMDNCTRVIETCNRGLEALSVHHRDQLHSALTALKYLCEGKYEEAISKYTEALNKQPHWAGGYSRRGDASYRLANIARAKADWQKAHAIDPSYPPFPHARRLIGIEGVSPDESSESEE